MDSAGGGGERIERSKRRQRQLMAAGILSLLPSYGNSTTEAGILKYFMADSVNEKYAPLYCLVWLLFFQKV